MSIRFETKTTLAIQTVECGECGIVFGLTETFCSSRLEDGKTFYCPNGHGRQYSESTSKKLERAKQELERLRKEREWAEQGKKKAEEAERALQKTLDAERAEHERERKRVSNGVCPCCNRTFVNLGRHMATKHPEHGRSS